MKYSRYINRELSWLDFNERVLEEADCKTNPLLERLKFLAITASNLDEFFMVRVGGLALNTETQSALTGIAGLDAGEQLKAIRKKVLAFNEMQDNCFHELEELLANERICRVSSAEDLTEDQQKYLRDFFVDEVMSTVAPVAVDQTGRLPLLTGARLCVCVRMKAHPETQLMSRKERAAKKSELDASDDPVNDRFIVIPLGKSIKRIVSVPFSEGFVYILLEDLIRMFVSELLVGQEIVETSTFRLTRNADISLNEDDLSDLLAGMEQLLTHRKTTGCIRLEIVDSASLRMRRYLQDVADVEEEFVYTTSGAIDYNAFAAVAGIPGFKNLKDAPWPPQQAPEFQNRNPFDVIAEGDRVLNHPYQSYDPVIDFIRAAAVDPNVIAIKQTLYRTARDSKVAEALITAAENGKNVTCIVELKARFDEARNIESARRLENAGVDVIYGVR
ncbi:MAG: RNA degradosome polyphosphate kinase, partial [Planctomycetota bacterium]